jgi:formylglycine-generating enzyme required for sulfatase activity
MRRAAIAAPSRPYPGIVSFQYLDHPIFFCRNEDSERLLRMATIYRGVLLCGVQGCGKSSLVNAGLLPRAVEGNFVATRLRLQPEPGKEIVIERISLQEEGKPPYLRSLFSESSVDQSRLVVPVDELARSVCGWTGDGYPLLIFDQFEEFITLFEEAPRGKARADALEAQKGVEAFIVSAVRDHSLRLKLLFSFREDYLAKLNKLFIQCPDLADISLRLAPLRTESLDEIIRGPFERCPGQFGRELPDTLMASLAEAIRERTGSGELNLSEVQLACKRLWNFTDPETEFRRKGVQGLLEDELEESLGTTGRLRSASISLLNRMVTQEGLRNVISEQDLVASTSKEDGYPTAEVMNALNALVTDTHLVRRERREDVVFYTILSEFLVPWIRKQKEMRRLQLQRRKWLRIAGLLAVVAAIAIGVAYYVEQYRGKDVRVGNAETRANRAEKAARAADDRALQAYRRLETESRLGADAHKKLEEETKLRTESNKKLQEANDRVIQQQVEADKLAKEKAAVLESLRRAQEKADADLQVEQRKLASAQEAAKQLEESTEKLRNENAQLKKVIVNPKGWVNPDDGLTYVWIPPGEFWMGCVPGDKECAKDETPRHRVKISKGFWIGQTEVTRAAYWEVLKRDPSKFDGPNDPVQNVTWGAAVKFCAASGGRLPTEAEWEYAARGGRDGLIYPRGNTISERDAKITSPLVIMTDAVKSYKPNGFGLYDMDGNVREWVADYYDNYQPGLATDPSGPKAGKYRVLRGGYWESFDKGARASFRDRSVPESTDSSIGFRCARELPSP